MNKCFVVRFVRNDDSPNEEYYYTRYEDAQYHLNLFRNDDSGLYSNIVLATTDDKGRD